MQAYVDALVSTPPNTLTIDTVSHTSPELRHILTLLRCTAPHPPGLKSLTLLTPITSGATASLAAAALAHHAPSLSALALPPLGLDSTSGSAGLPTPSAVVQLLSTLPYLSRLTSLDLNGVHFFGNEYHHACGYADEDAMDAAPGVLQALAAAVAALPALAHARVSDLAFPDTSGHPADRRDTQEHCRLLRGGAPGGSVSIDRTDDDNEPAESEDTYTTPQAALDHVITALSVAPALTSLTLDLVHGAGIAEVSCRGISRGFSSLQRLEIQHAMRINGSESPQAGRMPQRDSSTRAPHLASVWPIAALPSLHELSQTLATSLAEEAHVTLLIDNAARQPALRCARFDISLVGNRSLRGLGSAKGLAQLTQLTSVTVALEPAVPLQPVTVRAAAGGLGQLPALQSLELKLCANRVDVGVEDEDDESDSADALLPLRALTQLEELRVEISGLTQAREEFTGALFACDLRTFASLTRLHLKIVCIHAAELAPQVASLTRLRHLCVEGVTAMRNSTARVALAPLTALTALSVTVDAVPAGMVRCLAECFAGMPGLRRFELSAVDCHEDWLGSLVALPAWRGPVVYTFDCVQGFLKEDEYEGVRRLLAARGAVLPEYAALDHSGPLRVHFAA